MVVSKALNDSIIRYKKKYSLYRCSVSINDILYVQKTLGYSDEDVFRILEDNGSELKSFIESICRQNTYGVGKITSILYMSVLSEILYLFGIDFDIHTSFVLSTPIKDTLSDNDIKTVNYIYLQTKRGIKYHYFNGIYNDSTFNYLFDIVVEV